MNDSSTTLARLGIALGLFCARVVLLVVSVLIVLNATLLSPSFAKSSFRASGAYDTFVESTVLVMADDRENGLEPGDYELAQTLRQLSPVYEQALTPALLQTSTEKVLDGLDAWLKGKTERLEFAIDTAAMRSDLSVALAGYMSDRLATLPACPLDTDERSYDPLTADCRLDVPPSQDELLARADQLASEFPFLDEDRLTGDELFESSDSDAWREIPRAYWWGTFAMWLFAGLLVVIAAVVLYLSGDRIVVLRKIARIALGNGLALMIGGGLLLLVSAYYFQQFIDGALEGTDALARDTLLPLLQSLARGVGIWLLCLGAGFVVLSIAFRYAARLLNQRQMESNGPGGGS